MQQKAKIIWFAITTTLFTYGVVLFSIGKLQTYSFPTQFDRPLELISLVAPLALFANLTLYRRLMSKAKNPQAMMFATIIALAMNEFISIMGFVATFTSPEGNGFFFIANAAVTLLGNILVFPSGDWESKRV